MFNASFRDRPVYIQFSKHQELKTAPGITPMGGASPNYGGGSSPQSMTMVGVSAIPHGQPNSILRVIIENMLYPITIDVLHQIFAKYGDILKIVTFMKNSQFHALIQYPNEIIASTAKAALDGQNIYNGCCTLHIDYSKLSTLTVKFNNEKTRDFTRPELPSGEPEPPPLPDLSAYGTLYLAIFNPSSSPLSLSFFSHSGIHPALLQSPGMFHPLPLIISLFSFL
jgi:hnRNP-L/PTB/hephaestus splicing factor